jgi:hypothetical protein
VAMASRARPATSIPVIAPARNARVNPFCRPTCAAAAVRTFDRTDMFIPMNPATPERTAPITNPTAETGPRTHRNDHPDDRYRGVLASQIGLCTVLDRCGNLLHLGVAGVGTKHLTTGDKAIHDGQKSKNDGDRDKIHGAAPPSWSINITRPRLRRAVVAVATRSFPERASP